MNKSSYFIVGKHPVIEALKNNERKVLKIFLTEESKKTIHRESPNKNLLTNLKVFFKTKKELDNYCRNENILHQGFVAEVEKLDKIELKEYIKNKNNLNFVCLAGATDPRNIGSIIRSASAFNIDGLIVRERDYPDKSKLIASSYLPLSRRATAVFTIPSSNWSALLWAPIFNLPSIRSKPSPFAPLLLA